MQTIEDAKRKYLDKCPPSISGAGGHSTFYGVLCGFFSAFGITDMGEGAKWAQYYNSRLSDHDKWNNGDIAHKVRDALSAARGKSDFGHITKSIEEREKEKQARTNALGIRPRYISRNEQERKKLLRHAMNPTPPASTAKPEPRRTMPDGAGFVTGSPELLNTLARMRPFDLPGLERASEKGWLVFNPFWETPAGTFDVWALTDNTRRLIEARRMDGKEFPPAGPLGLRKSHTLKDSQKQWPVGIEDSKDLPCIALTEGGPDFLQCVYMTLYEDAVNRVAPVGMLCANSDIHPDALPFFKGKIVRIFPHLDKAGYVGTQKHMAQIKEAGAKRVEFFDFKPYRKLVQVEDLYDWRDLDPKHYADNPQLQNILP